MNDQLTRRGKILSKSESSTYWPCSHISYAMPSDRDDYWLWKNGKEVPEDWLLCPLCGAICEERLPRRVKNMKIVNNGTAITSITEPLCTILRVLIDNDKKKIKAFLGKGVFN